MEKTITFRDRNIGYRISGSGNVIVLLHGFLESNQIWDTFTSELSKSFTVVAVNLPGHGNSDVIAGTHTMQLMADCVKDVLLHEKIDRFVVCGHSMGGYAALELAESARQQVMGLVLFHSHAAADSEEVKENRRRTVEIVNRDKGGFIRQFMPLLFAENHVAEYNYQIKKLQETAADMSKEAVNAALLGMCDRESKLGFIAEAEFPFLFIIGKQDSRIPYEQTMKQASLPSLSEILLLSNAGHMGFYEAPAYTLEALRHFACRCFKAWQPISGKNSSR